MIQQSEEKRIYQQIAELIEAGVLSGAYPEDSAVPSTNQFARVYQINPATAAKGFNTLVEQGILYKKRGLGMYVSAGAKERLREQRRKIFLGQRLRDLIEEAERLGISREQLILEIQRMDAER